MENAHERVRVALNMSGLSTDGKLSECVERLMMNGKSARKRSATSSFHNTMRQILRDEMVDVVTSQLEKLDPSVLDAIADGLGKPGASSNSASEVALLLCKSGV